MTTLYTNVANKQNWTDNTDPYEYVYLDIQPIKYNNDNIDGVLIFAEGTIEFHMANENDAYCWDKYPTSIFKSVMENFKVYEITTNRKLKYFKVINGHVISRDIRQPEKWVKEMGGLDKILAKAQRTEFISLKEAYKRHKENLRDKKHKKNQENERVYRELIGNNKTIQLTPENIRIVLAYLNTVNWGAWDLPKTDRPATFRQHNCDGHIVTTLSLETPVEYRGMPVMHFKHGTCPRGHLTKYTSI